MESNIQEIERVMRYYLEMQENDYFTEEVDDVASKHPYTYGKIAFTMLCLWKRFFFTILIKKTRTLQYYLVLVS